jgi:hypothetical protein
MKKTSKPEGTSGWALIGIGLLSFAVTAVFMSLGVATGIFVILFGGGVGILLIVIGIVALAKNERITND